MYLIPKELVTYSKWHSFLDFELLGYWQSSEACYYSCGLITPVSLGHTKSEYMMKGLHGATWQFGYLAPGTNPGHEWALFFRGCDDGHTGIMFESREAALQWIADCTEVDFSKFIYNEKYKDITCYHN